MTADRPQSFTWDGDAMIPRSPKLANEAYCVGEVYILVPHEDRSDASHNHEFGWLRDAWLNLKSEDAASFPTPTHLRKRALIEANFYDEEIIDADTSQAAERVAAFVRKKDDFALVIVRDNLVIVRTAKSQSRRSMDKDTFQKSKTALIEIVSEMIDVTPEKLLEQSQ